MSSEKNPREETQRFQFTHKRIEKLKAPAEGREHYYDLKESDLGLRVEASGRKSFFWYKSVAGSPTFKALGKFPATDVKTAGAAARKLTGKLDEYRRAGFEGPNPFQAEGSDRRTFGEMFDAYISKHVEHHAVHPEAAAKRDKWMLEKYMSGWRNRTAKGITRADIRRLHRSIGEKHGGVIADRVVQMIRRVFQWCTVTEELFAGPNPCKGVEFYGHTKRKRFLSGPELAALFTAMRDDPNRDLVDFVNLSLWTGARRNDVLSMQWANVQLADNCWVIPEPKGGKKKSYRVPLVPEAITILKRRAVEAAEGAVWVFPSTGATGHWVEPKRSWTQLLKRAGLKDVHIHDLRRTLSSWQAGMGYSETIIGKSLGHEPGSEATAVYAQLDLAPVREALGAAVTAMRKASRKKPRRPATGRKLLAAAPS